MVEPAKFDLELYRGAGFSKSFTYTADGAAVNLTGYTITASIKTTADDTVDPAVSFTVTVSSPSTGVIVLSLTGTQTATLSAARCVWDLKLVPSGGQPDVLLYGDLRVRARVTE
jgi:hypothetical protein